MLHAADIRDFTLFSGLDEDEFESIAVLGNRKEFNVNDIIFSPGMCTTDVYLLEDGNESIQMEIQGKDGGPPVVVHTIDRGELFSWDPLCPPRPRTTAARVIRPATVIVIAGSPLKKLLEENDHVGCIVMKNLSAMLSARLSYVTVILGSEVIKFREKQPVR